MKTTNITKEYAHSKRVWYLIDAKDLILGRMCVKISNLLRGKDKVNFTPNHDCGDYVVVINSKKVRMSGNKLEDEKWYRHSGYPGGIKSRTGKVMVDEKSRDLIINAVKGMLPKNKSLSKAILHKLKVYETDEHKQQAQQLITYDVK